jgi:hypothetical protein
MEWNHKTRYGISSDGFAKYHHLALFIVADAIYGFGTMMKEERAALYEHYMLVVCRLMQLGVGRFAHDGNIGCYRTKTIAGERVFDRGFVGGNMKIPWARLVLTEGTEGTLPLPGTTWRLELGISS